MGSMAVFDQTGASIAPFVVLLVRFISNTNRIIVSESNKPGVNTFTFTAVHYCNFRGSLV